MIPRESQPEDFERNRVAKPPQIGGWGLPPHEPCRQCGCVYFRVMDWNMGYFCGECNKPFGTKEEWDKYRKGEPR